MVGPAAASDWGYDESEGDVQGIQPLRARALPLGKSNAQPAAAQAAGKPAGSSAARAKLPPKAMPAASSSKAQNAQSGGSAVATHVPTSTLPLGTAGGAGIHVSPTAETQALVQECWSQIYELAAARKLEQQERAHIDELVAAKMKAGGQAKDEARSVVSFLPKLTSYLVVHPEQKPNYGALLRALLRWRARRLQPAVEAEHQDQLAAEESNLTAEILGPLRLAVPGTVPFSEEAVNAYADMACFIYEQRNPGKSVDATDNRAMFAQVVADKFKDAPTNKDREAMAAFDLAWAKFKIVWTQADESERAVLLDGLLKSGAGAAWSRVKDPMLQLVLSHWPAAVPASNSVASRAAESQRR